VKNNGRIKSFTYLPLRTDDHILEWHLTLPLSVIEKSIIPPVMLFMMSIKTLAASGIKNFGRLLNYAANSSALKRNVTIEEVGNAAAFLCSDLASVESVTN
jgi:hypothetical protein